MVITIIIMNITIIADILGLSILISFTLVTTVIAIVSRGAMFYFYEPNKLILALEICMGLYAVIYGANKMREVLSRNKKNNFNQQSKITQTQWDCNYD